MKKVVHTDNAPKVVGPYSQAVHAGNLVFTSGQLPIDPETGAFVKGDIKAQTRQVMENLKTVLEAAGTNLSKAVKVTVFLKDIGNFSDFNEAYGAYFPTEPPARSAFQVAALPLDAEIEIEVVALA